MLLFGQFNKVYEVSARPRNLGLTWEERHGNMSTHNLGVVVDTATGGLGSPTGDSVRTSSSGAVNAGAPQDCRWLRSHSSERPPQWVWEWGRRPKPLEVEGKCKLPEGDVDNPGTQRRQRNMGIMVKLAERGLS